MLYVLDACVISDPELGTVFSALLPQNRRTSAFLIEVHKLLNDRFAGSFRGLEFSLLRSPLELKGAWSDPSRLSQTHILYAEQENMWVYEVRKLEACYPTVALVVVMPGLDLLATIKHHLLGAEVNSYLCYRAGDFPEGLQTF